MAIPHAPNQQQPSMARIRQRGVALLMAMLTVTLVASFAAAAAWQQWRAVEVETSERGRLQAGWILVGALDWARLILREDSRKSSDNDNLTEPWATPLEEARLSSFLASDKNNTALSEDELNSEVFLSGQIVDVQSRMNIKNLLDGNTLSKPAMDSFFKLFQQLNLDPVELVTMADNLRLAADNTGDPRATVQAPVMPERVEQLVWLGIQPATLERLKPFVCVLLGPQSVNINTASAEVLYASIPGLEWEGARRMVTARANKYFRTTEESKKFLPQKPPASAAAGTADPVGMTLSVNSRFFEVSGRLRLADRIIQERSLVQRDNPDVKTLWRERAVVTPFGKQASLQ
jgi:general secretion pathway protein K